MEQPRERSVPCRLCGHKNGKPVTQTWATSGLCERHEFEYPLNASAYIPDYYQNWIEGRKQLTQNTYCMSYAHVPGTHCSCLEDSE